MLRNDAVQNSAHIHYTFDTQHSIGLRVRYDRDADLVFTGAQLNRLIKRWNKPDSQANIYGRVAIGQVNDEHDEAELRSKRGSDAALFLGVSGDWETRKYFISGAAEHWDYGRFGSSTIYHARAGFAPYVANTGALHTWLMTDVRHRPNANDPLTAIALARFFKGPGLLEVGIDTQGQPLLSYVHRF